MPGVTPCFSASACRRQIGLQYSLQHCGPCRWTRAIFYPFGEISVTRDLIWKAALALLGCLAAAYVGDELLGGAALGWIAGGAILGVTCMPLFKTLLDRRKL